jgi:NAD(P)-dependent dehydrogenase (short-subunit alcohol dehydrogenase family)
MPRIDATALLRPGVLQGVSLVLAGADGPAAADPAGSLGAGVSAACERLGAQVLTCQLDAGISPVVEEARTGELLDGLLASDRRVDLLAVDAASLFGSTQAESGDGARTALRRCLEGSWSVTRALVERAFLPDGHGGRIVYIAPPPDAGEHADAACAGLENLARTLSIEWARYGITVVTIAPGSGGASAANEAAAVTAYLASPAGAYFSGCLLDLRGPV